MVYVFDDYSLDCERRELRRGADLVPIEPQVFDLLVVLIRNRGRVVGKDELLAEVWRRRIVSDSTVSSRITAARHAVGDSGSRQRLIRTTARRGFRFIGTVRENAAADEEVTTAPQPAPAADEPAAFRAQRRQLTIVVCGTAGTAALSARVDPEELHDIVVRRHRDIREVVERHGGHLARYTDDGAVAWFGYPQAREDDAERAVRAGLALAQAVGVNVATRPAERLQLRIGIATGLVLVGDAGGGVGTAEHPATGEAPYVAARLQELAEPGAVLISAGTRRLVGDLFDYGEPAGTQPSAADASPGAARVLRESAIASRFEALHPHRMHLIGRNEELALLSRRWTQARAGEGRVVLVWGEPGIGKSHLVAAFQDAIASDAHACLRFFCLPNRVQAALHPVVTQLEHAAAIDPGDADEVRLAKLERLLTSSSADLATDVPLFAELLATPTGGRYAPPSLSLQRRKELLLERFAAQLSGLAARRPLLMVLEDAHWLDHTTRELFDIVVERIRDLPALLIVTYRPEFDPPWLGQAHVTRLTLNRLGRRDNADLVRQVAGGKELPPRLVDRIVARTDGVPLFVEEVTKSILESGLLRMDGDAYVLDGMLPVVAVPATLQASLVARLDRIARARGVVRIAAALGREFRYAVLKAVTLLPDAELGAALDQLVDSGLVHRRGSAPHSVCAFKHALVQDAAYETIPKGERPAIHRRIVEVLEREFPDLAVHHPDVLAHHCAEAGLAERAVDFWIKAVRIALDRSAGVEAQNLVEQAVRMLPGIITVAARRRTEGRVHVAAGAALVMTEGFASPQVLVALSKARELLDESTHPSEALEALCGLFNYHLIRSESPICLKLAEARLRPGMARPTATVVHYQIGTAQLHLGNFALAIGHLEQALALYDESDCRPVSFIAGYHLRSFTLIWLGLARLYVGSLADAARTVAAAVDDARRRAHPFTLVSALLALARFCNHTRQRDGAIAATEEGMAIAVEQRSRYHLSRASVLRAVNVVEGGRPEEGIALMTDALAAHHATGARFQSSYNLSCLARAHAAAGRAQRAAALAKDAVTEVRRTGERWWGAEAERIRGEVLLAASAANAGAAEACFGRALDCARAQGARLWELNAALSLATLWSSRGDGTRAAQLLRPVCAGFTDGYRIEALDAAERLLTGLAAAPAPHAARRGH